LRENEAELHKKRAEEAKIASENFKRRERKCKEKEMVKEIKLVNKKQSGFVERNLEEIKDRYYFVVRELLMARGKAE
jgi:hypothetical protein